MEIGKLRHLIEIQHFTVTENDFGEELRQWETLKKTRAEISPFSGREFLQSQSVQSEINTRIKVRFDKRIEPTMRIKFRDTIYQIEAVLEDNKSLREYQTLLCKSGVIDE